MVGHMMTADLLNKVPQTEWLKTTGITCLLVLEARSLKARGQLPLKEAEVTVPSFPFPASGSLRPSLGL